MSEVNLSLSTLGGGAMEEQFQQLIPALLSQLKHGQKASISIGIDFKRVDNTDTMITTSYRLTPKFPAISKASICQVTGDNRLKTDAPIEKPKLVNLFNGTEGGSKNE
ncbi:hypothetical protein [Sporomusa malonica]|uniref:Uncharacterized protein n=1 Tax=Sporomusa malonica TaxID=112901 RepID=A0A1W2ATU1_9FIRM|nr:hypothetical protein [Sporomusa malonica]SMC64133.1 hypothetical protein SAMN04488500_106114 [Sporomusa malonica]